MANSGGTGDIASYLGRGSGDPGPGNWRCPTCGAITDFSTESVTQHLLTSSLLPAELVEEYIMLMGIESSNEGSGAEAEAESEYKSEKDADKEEEKAESEYQSEKDADKEEEKVQRESEEDESESGESEKKSEGET